MKILSIFTALLISAVAGFSQGGPIYRNPATTNQFMNSPGAGEIPIWNSTASKWSNGIFSATATNIPAYVLTNNQSSPINLGSSVRVAGTQTNVGALYFDDKWYIDSAGGFFQLSNPSSGVNALTFNESTDSITIGTAGGTPVVTVPTLLRTDSNDITGHLNVNSFYSTNGFKLSNTLIVDTNGNDSTAIRSSFLRPFLTITGAVASVQNGDTILVRPGLYTVTPKIAETNRQGAINLFNLTNVTIISGGIGAVIDGSSALGEIFYATNCLNLTVEGFRIRGMVGTNITSIGTVNEIWGSFSYYNCPGIKIRNNFFDGGHDHGTFDMATFNSTSSGWTAIHATNPPVIRFNEFYNFGSARTNSNLSYDGTAISPTVGIIENNWIHDCYRAIEPYAASAEANVFRGTIIRNNLIQNCLEDAITTAGSTNGWNVLIEGNRIEYTAGYTRRGTNVFDDAVAILWNSGQRPIIRNNYIYGAPYRGIQVASSIFIEEPEITGNWVEETTNAVGNATAIEVGGGTTYTVSGAKISGNTIKRARSEGLKLAGVRDSFVKGNTLINPTTITGEGAAIRINSSVGMNSNIVVEGNLIMDNSTATVMDYGIYIDAGAENISLINNPISGAGTDIQNNAGVEVAILQPPTALTASRALILDSSGRMTTASGTPDGTKFLKDDGTYATPSGGSGSADADNRAIQFNLGDAFAGTNQFTYDRTNSRVGINLAGEIPNRGIELGGSATQAAILMGAGTSTNEVYYSGIRTISSQDLQLGVAAGYIWYIDNDDGAIHPPANGLYSVGSPGAEVSTVHQQYATNRTYGLPGSGSTVTLYSTNQYWKMHQTSNVTFAVSGLRSNVIYSTVWTNNASTITWPGTLRWIDSFGYTTAPSLQEGTHIVHIFLDDNGTNAYVKTGPSYNLAAGWGKAFSTNAGTITITTTNRPASIATNATSTTVGFSDAENVQIYNAWFHLTTNLVVSPTNLIVGRTICVRFDTNSLTYDVMVTNTAANPVNWNFNVATNGSTSFTKTNTMRARLFLTAETNGVISADFGYYR